MAFTATVEWDVRTTGSDSNGGGFDTALSGTDYSQQDTPQIAFTDLVIDGTTNTKCTSAGNPFGANHVGNIINITGGTGFTVQRVLILSVAAGVATVDKSLGTLSSTGGTGNLGGAFQTIAAAIAVMVASNTVHIKNGTYTITAALAPSAFSGITAGPTSFIGFQTTHRDGGTKPLITTSTNGIKIFSLAGGNCWRFSNLHLEHTAGTRGSGIHALGATVIDTLVDDCLIDGCQVGINGNFTVDWEFFGLFVQNTEIKNSVSHAIINASYTQLSFCYIHDNGGDGLNTSTTSKAWIIEINQSIFDTNVNGFAMGANNSNTGVRLSVQSSVFFGQSTDAIHILNNGSNGSFFLTCVNNIFYNNTSVGVHQDFNDINGQLSRTNAYGANGTDRTNFIAGVNDVSLSGDPFTNSGAGDFSLNNTAGAGAACRNAGFQL